jgi:hypothetical protein
LVVIQPCNLAHALLVLAFVPAALILFQRRQMRLLREFAGTQNGGSLTPLPAD